MSPVTLNDIRAQGTGNRGQSASAALGLYRVLLARRLEGQSDAVDAVAQSGGRRTVLEHVAEMPAAAAAVHLGARHAEAAVDGGRDGTLEGLKKTRPAGAAFKFTPGREERLGASGAAERAGPVLLQESTGSGRLGAVAAQHGVLLGRQRFTPFLV